MDAGSDIAARTIVVTRSIDAPRALVFDAFTDPDHLARWWGPNGFSTSTSAFSLKPGGVWRFVMHGPDGRDYQNRVVFDEIRPPSRLVFHHTGGEEPGLEPVHHTTTVTFEEIGGRTLVTLVAVFPTAEECATVIREHKADEGGAQTLGRLAAMLEEDLFVFRRRLEAPRPLVWTMWTVAAHLARWWGPKGASWISGTIDLRPGGAFHYGMTYNGAEMWGRFVFHDIESPDRLSFVSSFSDRDGGITRAPFFTDWPLEVFNTVTFMEDGDGTIVTLKAAPLNATVGERARFRSIRESMNHGFAGTFEALEAYLKNGAGR